MAKKKISNKNKRTDVLYYRMLVVFAALIAVIFSITYFTATMERYNTFTFGVVPIILVVFAVLFVAATLYFVIQRVRGTDEYNKAFSSGYLFMIVSWLLSVFALYQALTTKRLIAYVLVTAALYFIFYIYSKEFFIFSLYNVVNVVALVLMNSASLRIILAVFLALVSAAAVLVVIKGRKAPITLKMGKGSVKLTDAPIAPLPFCISIFIVVAGAVLNFVLMGAAFYSIIALFACYLVCTVINTIRMM